jgi:hypothetical protein
MPQTRFVLKKALSLGLKVVVVINKIDRCARVHACLLACSLRMRVCADAVGCVLRAGRRRARRLCWTPRSTCFAT